MSRDALVADLLEILNHDAEESLVPAVTENEVGFIADSLIERGWTQPS